MDFRVVIPARYASTRFPGKALADLAGEPVIQHVFRRAQESGAREILIATDDQRIAAAAQAFGADVILTSADHATGTDRIAAVVDQQGWPADDIVVNVQGDAPLIPGRSIKQVATLLAEHPSAAIATLCVPLADAAEYRDPNVVKVVFDAGGRALYFSRGSIPARAHGHEAVPSAWRHIGLGLQTDASQISYIFSLPRLISLMAGPNMARFIVSSCSQPLRGGGHYRWQYRPH